MELNYCLFTLLSDKYCFHCYEEAFVFIVALPGNPSM
jgi:hypothetical protein